MVHGLCSKMFEAVPGLPISWTSLQLLHLHAPSRQEEFAEAVRTLGKVFGNVRCQDVQCRCRSRLKSADLSVVILAIQSPARSGCGLPSNPDPVAAEEWEISELEKRQCSGEGWDWISDVIASEGDTADYLIYLLAVLLCTCILLP